MSGGGGRAGQSSAAWSPRGEDHWNHTLTAKTVRWIRRAHRDGWGSYVELAEEVGVDFSTIGKVVRGERWRHLER